MLGLRGHRMRGLGHNRSRYKGLGAGCNPARWPGWLQNFRNFRLWKFILLHLLLPTEFHHAVLGNRRHLAVTMVVMAEVAELALGAAPWRLYAPAGLALSRLVVLGTARRENSANGLLEALLLLIPRRRSKRRVV